MKFNADVELTLKLNVILDEDLNTPFDILSSKAESMAIHYFIDNPSKSDNIKIKGFNLKCDGVSEV